MATDLICTNCGDNLGKDKENPKHAWCWNCGTEVYNEYATMMRNNSDLLKLLKKQFLEDIESGDDCGLCLSAQSLYTIKEIIYEEHYLLNSIIENKNKENVFEDKMTKNKPCRVFGLDCYYWSLPDVESRLEWLDLAIEFYKTKDNEND